MDSDDEFENPVASGSQVINGLNFKELLETGGTDFCIKDDSDKRLRSEEKAMRRREKLSKSALEDEFFKNYKTNKIIREMNAERIRIMESENPTYEEFSRIMENVTPDGKIKKLIVEPGLGKEMEIGQIAYIHYTVCMEKGGDVEAIIDNSRNNEFGRRGRKGDPFRFKVGVGAVLPILDLGVITMQPNEVAKFLAHHDYAYGKLGLLPLVPPETTVMVTIKLMKVEEGSAKSDLFDLSKEHRIKLPFDELYKGVLEKKQEGAESFRRGDYDVARMSYKKAMQIVQDIVTPHENENVMKLHMLYILYNNIAQCRMNENNFGRAKDYCVEALNLPIPKTEKLKAYFRLAKCFDELGQMEEARKHIVIAKTLHGSNVDVDELYDKIHDKIRKDRDDEKEYARNMFKKN